jgi:hypothetical protein
MKNILLNILLSLLAVSGVNAQQVSPANPNPVDPAIIAQLTGTWKNQLGSTLTISNIDASSGQISGSYRSPSGAGSNTEYPLLGWVNTIQPGTSHTNHVVVVSFSVRWGQIGTVTAWNGSYTINDNPPVIIGQWLLSRPNSDYGWDHVLTGQDQFHRSP